jgi:large repetitive protein
MSITGLSTSSSSVQLGSATPFTANISSGSSVSYTWAFGDGAIGTGANTAHVYVSVGAYTVVVTATNGLSTVTQTMQVQVNDVPVSGLVINNSVGGSAPVGTQVTFSGQVGAGSNVTYTWLVDGVVVGSGPSLPYTFDTPGAHTITVIAGNGAGTQTSTTTITVTGNAVLNRKFYVPIMRVISR